MTVSDLIRLLSLQPPDATVIQWVNSGGDGEGGLMPIAVAMAFKGIRYDPDGDIWPATFARKGSKVRKTEQMYVLLEGLPR